MKNKKAPIKSLLLVLSVLVLAACFLVPIPYYIEQPGATIDLSKIIQVNGDHDDLPGSFSLTSVGIRQATVFTALKSKLDEFQDLVTEEELFGGATDEEYQRIQKYYMDSSQNNAIQQALKLANLPYDMEYKGVYVMGVDPKSSFFGEISVGDTVTEVDGHKFDSSQNFIEYVQSQAVGDEMSVTFIQDGTEKTATGKLIELSANQKAGIGITLVDHTEIASGEEITIDSGNIGGPSAGLMFALEIYEQLTGQNLRKGKKVAGTGTIDQEGNVGRIGGIDKKIASAVDNGVEIFFAPDDALTPEELKNNPSLKSNYEEAKTALAKLDSDMVLVPVKTIQDALDYLAQL